jgi:hypothetical protein
MANIDFAALDGNARAAAVLYQSIVMKLADTGSLRNAPCFLNVGSVNGTGSDSIQVPVVGLNGTDIMSAPGDGVSVSNTSITSAAATVVVARQALRYDLTDLARITNSVAGGVDVEGLAGAMVTAFEGRFNQLACALSSGFSTQVGSTGVDMTTDTFYSAIFALQLQSVTGMYDCILHPQQYNDLMSSLRAETGPGQYLPANQAQTSALGSAFKGELFGVRVHVSSYVPTANSSADYRGQMLGNGAIAYALGTPAPIQAAGGVIIPAGAPVAVELERDAASGLLKVVGSAFLGVAELQDLKGVGIVSDL